MTEEIIIDCAFYKDGVCASPINKNCEYCKNIDVSKCYHKQLKRLEQENKTIREHCKQVDETNKILYKEKCDLIQENEELNKRFERRGELMVMVVKKRERYRSVLEEIKKYIVDELCGYYHSKKEDYNGILENIENKIDEALNEGK